MWKIAAVCEDHNPISAMLHENEFILKNILERLELLSHNN